MSKPLEILVDGKPATDGWPLDRGLQYGDGVFETLRVRNGIIRFQALHHERLALGCRRLAIDVDLAHLWAHTRQLASRHGDAMVKVQVTRGDATARGYAPVGSETARIISSVFAPPRAADLPPQLCAVTLESQLGENPQLAGIKHCNRLEQVLARASMRGTEAFEGLMASSSGLVISGTMSNLYLELEGEFVTPMLNRCGIAGVTRQVVLREAAALGIALRVAEIPMVAVRKCTGLAISNARLGLLPMAQLDGRPLRASSQLLELAARLETLEN